jgi:hypothetical protein
MSYRFRLPLLAVLAVMALTLPAVSATEPALTSPEVAPADACSAAATEDALWLAPPPPIDFLLCSCANCRAHPYEDCQISPDGYSIACSDWLRLHCDK